MMLRRTGWLCVALAMFAIAGGPWAVLQAVAWGEMLRDYCQRSGSFTVAIAQTFDGQHPCDLCRQIQVAKGQQEKEGRQTPAASWAKTDGKVKATLATRPVDPEWQESTLAQERTAWTGQEIRRLEAPPTPPPRRPGLAA